MHLARLDSLSSSIFTEVPAILRLAIPIIIGLLAGAFMGVIDTIMIAPLGTQALAATSLATSALIIVHSALFGLLSVVTVGMASAFGEGAKRLPEEVSSGLMLALIASAIVAVAMICAAPLFSFLQEDEAILGQLAPYWIAMAGMTIPYALFSVLRGLYSAIDKPWIIALFALIGVIANVGLNWIFIYRLDWGLAGAGIASVLAKFSVLAITIIHWRTSETMTKYRETAAVSSRIISGHIRQGVPVSLGSFGEGGAYAFTGLMMAWVGAAALAANQVSHSIGAVFYMVPLGMSAAVAVRIGQAVGEGSPERYRMISNSANLVMVGWATVTFAPIFMFRDLLAGWLSEDAEVIAFASSMFITMAFLQFADGLQSIALGALRGLKDNKIPNFISITMYWVLALPFAYFVGFSLGFGPSGIFAGYAAGVLCAAIILQMRFFLKSRNRSEIAVGEIDN